jgi:hypothetical protein
MKSLSYIIFGPILILNMCNLNLFKKKITLVRKGIYKFSGHQKHPSPKSVQKLQKSLFLNDSQKRLLHLNKHQDLKIFLYVN